MTIFNDKIMTKFYLSLQLRKVLLTWNRKNNYDFMFLNAQFISCKYSHSNLNFIIKYNLTNLIHNFLFVKIKYIYIYTHIYINRIFTNPSFYVDFCIILKFVIEDILWPHKIMLQMDLKFYAVRVKSFSLYPIFWILFRQYDSNGYRFCF